MKLHLIIGLLCLFFLPAMARAAPEGGVTSQATYSDGGNNWRPISVNQSTSSVVLISTTPRGSLLDIGTWRYREIVNLSTCAQMTLFPNDVGYTSYSSSYSVVLSSDQTGNNQGDSYVVPHQGPVYAIWGTGSATCGNVGFGAGGVESFYDPKRDRLPEGQK